MKLCRHKCDNISGKQIEYAIPMLVIFAENAVCDCGISWTYSLFFFYISNDVMQSNNSSLQRYSVLSDILVKNELCIPLKRGSTVLSTGEGFICLFPHSKLKIAVLFCSIYKNTISISAIMF